jgi:DNA-binding MarR family transcriptional regulator
MPQTTADTALAGALRDAVGRLGRRMRHQSPHPELSLGQLAALRSVELHGSMSPGELAEHEKVQPPSMTRVIAALEARELVTRAPHPTDGRQVRLTVTDQGRDLVQQSRKLRQAWMAQRLRELSPEERAILRAAAPILQRLSQS